MNPARNTILRTLRLAAAIGLVLFLALAQGARAAPTNETGDGQFRFGFSSATFMLVNENDAKAGIKIWARVLLQERGLPVDPEPVILNSVEEITDALRSGRINAITLNTDEYWRLAPGLVTGPFIAGLNDGRITEEYVVLVHQDSKIEQLEGLRGRSLSFYQNTRMPLASVWLDVVLLKAGFPPAAEFCKVSSNSKLTKVVLPVFFRKVDACVVTRRGFNTMAELNPQVGQRLKVIASSPEVVSTGFVFRSGYTNSLKDTIVAELAKIKDSTAGQQVLTLFQSGSLEAQPLSCLDSALDLLETHRRLTAAANLRAAIPTAAGEAAKTEIK